MFNGIKSVIYPSKDLATDKAFWENVTGVKPYFDEPYYVGFQVNGTELGLDPNAAAEGLAYPVSYWYVDDAKAASEHLVESGAKRRGDIKDVGGGMLMATFEDVTGNIFGIIEHPND